MIIIDNQAKFDSVCEQICKESSMISVDTEFERRSTYFAKLSIIQIIANNNDIIIDTRANLNLTSFKSILLNKDILKIFHSPREDFEIFYNLFHIVPVNICDTQIAAAVVGYGKALSYKTLCQDICNVEIDKTLQTANWLQRPLPISMLEYAIEDAKHLEPIYKHLQSVIIQRSLEVTYNQNIGQLLNSKNYIVDFLEIWKKVKFNSHSQRIKYNMQFIAAFREECAIKANLPRKHFATDADLVQICQYLPTTKAALQNLTITKKHILNEQYCCKLLELCSGLSEI